MTFVTIAERKRRSAEKLAAAATEVMADLSEYARAVDGSGRFIVFGSAAAGAIRHDSDFDVIVDFPPDQEAAAWRAAEAACCRHAIKPDVLPTSMTRPEFIANLMRKPVVVLP